MKRIITAVILVTLIFAMFGVLSAPNVKAESSEAAVTNYSWYIAPADTYLAYQGDLIVVGQVQNVGSSTIGYVSLQGRAYNSSYNLPLGFSSGETWMPYILPGQTAPFYMDFMPESSTSGDNLWASSVDNVTVSITSVDDTLSWAPYSGLTTTAVTSSNHAGTFTVTGNVKNTGDQTVQHVWVAATFYNASGTVIGLNYQSSYLSNSFAPGNSVPFSATPTDNTAQLSNAITNYSLQIFSEPLTASTSPSPSTSPTHSPSSTTTPSNGQLPVTIMLGAGIVVVVVVVLSAFTLLRKRAKNAQIELPPPPPPPPQP